MKFGLCSSFPSGGCSGSNSLRYIAHCSLLIHLIKLIKSINKINKSNKINQINKINKSNKINRMNQFIQSQKTCQLPSTYYNLPFIYIRYIFKKNYRNHAKKKINKKNKIINNN